MSIGKGNYIDPSVVVPDFVDIGDFNYIGKNVIIQSAKGSKSPRLRIGDCNIINNNTKIIVSDAGIEIKDWNVIHDNTLLIGGDGLGMKHNCWIGQNTILDGSGQLYIGNGVRVGMYSQIWTHVASGEQIEGCLLFVKNQTVIEDEVWLVGSCTVGSGLNLGKRSICLGHSVVTKDTEPGKVYAGAPAIIMKKLNFWRRVELLEKFDMILGWANQFAKEGNDIKVTRPKNLEIIITDIKTKETLIFTDGYDIDEKNNPLCSIFNLQDKTFHKRKTQLEMNFYKFIYNNKARFTPIV